jgi:hypothetical protein
MQEGGDPNRGRKAKANELNLFISVEAGEIMLRWRVVASFRFTYLDIANALPND